MKRIILSLLLLVAIVVTFTACKDNDKEKETDNKEDNKKVVQYTDDLDIENTNVVESIIYHEEASKLSEDRTDEAMDALEKVPNSSVTYVSVDALGKVYGMGGHFQGYSVGVAAEPISGYRYAGCESDTIEFYEYKPNDHFGYDVPWFKVPESGEHIIYVYFEPIG